MDIGRGFARLGARLHSDQRGFSLAEALIAGFILAVAGFAVAQAITFGLSTTGLARQRTAAQALAEQQMELARAHNYDNVVLCGTSGCPAVAHSDDPDSPDHWVDDGPPLAYDPDESGSLDYEPLIVEDKNPSLLHYQTDVQQGNTAFTVYTYVTWVDAPEDGLVGVGVGDNADGNGDGQSDADGHDMKRVTVVVTWSSLLDGVPAQLKMSSLFSEGELPYKPPGGGSSNNPPAVQCPTSSANGLQVSFTAQASDPDGTVVRIDWDFEGDGITNVPNGGVNQTHTYPSAGTYTVVNKVWDDDGASASNQSSGCQVTVSASGGDDDGDEIPPTGTIVIAGGSAYTNSTQVTITLSATDQGGSGLASMQFSFDGDNYGAAVPYATSTILTLPGGDGTKTVYVKFIDGAGNVSDSASDTIILDTAPPGAPSGLSATRSINKREVTLQWNAPSPLPSDLAGYQVWRRATTSTTWVQASCQYIYGIPTKCQDTGLSTPTNYEYYVVTVDNAGNQSAHSNHVTV